MKIVSLIKTLSAVVLATLAITGLTACSPEEEPPTTAQRFAIDTYIDGEKFADGQPIEFATLVPNQKQTKKLTIENIGDLDAIITDLAIVTNGNIFDNGAVVVDILTADGVPIAGTTIVAGQVIEAQIVLTTADNLGSGLSGAISLDFKAKQSPTQSTPTPTPEPTEKEEDK